MPAYEIAIGEFSIEGFEGKNFDVTTKAMSEKDLRLRGQQMRSDNVNLDMMHISFLPPSGNRMQGQGSALNANSRKAVDAMYPGMVYSAETECERRAVRRLASLVLECVQQPYSNG